MIFEVLLKGLCFVLKILFTLIKSLFPFISIPANFFVALAKILSTTEQANNFIYFIFGDTAFILIPSLILLLTFKYIIYPVVNLLIGVVSNKASM